MSSPVEVPDSPVATHDLEPVLRLQPLGDDRFRSIKVLANMRGFIYGGQLIANALTAAMMTTSGRRPHVIQVFFLRPGTLQEALEMGVQRLRDGATVSHRRVEMRQGGKLVLTADVSFHEGSSRPEHQTVAPHGIPMPEALEEMRELLERYGDRIAHGSRKRALVKHALLVKPVDPRAALLEPSSKPELEIWIKLATAVPDEPLFQYAAVALMSDMWLPATTRTMHVPSPFEESAGLVSLNHGLWFHELDPSAQDWLLYILESPVARHGRGVGRGLLYNRSGRLIASSVQEALLL
jgi:acyl-CoA thioesterase-2